MASSNQGEEGGGGESQNEPSQLTTNHLDKCATNPASPLPLPPLPPTTSYATYPPPGLTYPPYATYYTATGYPSIPGGGHNPHAYPQGYAAYTTEYFTGYPANCPSAAPVASITPAAPIAPYYGPPPTYHPNDTNAKLLRSFILCCCVILMCILLASLVIALTLQPELPIYRVVSMIVANFTTTPSLSGEWNTKMTIENPNNKKITTFFSDFKVDLMYKDGVITMNGAPSFALHKKETREIEVKSWSGHANEETLERNTKDDMAKEQSSGSVTFTLRVSSVNLFKSGSFSTKGTDIVAICEGLKVVFQSNNATTGALDNGGKPIECQLYA